MKCKYCDGDGVIVDVEYAHAGKYTCGNCDGAGVVEPLTEQEYIQTCNTEQLAECLARYFYGWTTNSAPYDIILHNVREWLKQPHTAK